MRISDWSSDVCSSDLMGAWLRGGPGDGMQRPFLLFRFGDEAADRDVHRLEGRVDRRALGQRRPALAADELVERRLLRRKGVGLVLEAGDGNAKGHGWGSLGCLRQLSQDRKSTRLNSSH